jgi:MFS family permease
MVPSAQDPYFRPRSDFDNPNGALLGVITAAFSIGAVLAIPVVPCTSSHVPRPALSYVDTDDFVGVNDRFGRKASIVVGSLILAIGVILQTASVNSMSSKSILQTLDPWSEN